MLKQPLPPNGPRNFGELPWDDLYPRLLLAGTTKIRRMIWMGEFHGQVPGGRTAHDFIHTAVEKLLSGERQWNSDKSAYENLWGVVSSEISNCGTSAENKLTSRIEKGEKVIQLPTPGPTPEAATIRQDLRDNLLRYLRARDREAARMAELMFAEDLTGSKELAETMGLTSKEIDTIKKRLNRLIKAYLRDSEPDDQERLNRLIKAYLRDSEPDDQEATE